LKRQDEKDKNLMDTHFLPHCPTGLEVGIPVEKNYFF
jgi:hypothetical protein